MSEQPNNPTDELDLDVETTTDLVLLLCEYELAVTMIDVLNQSQ